MSGVLIIFNMLKLAESEIFNSFPEVKGLNARLILVRQLQGLVGTTRGGQPYVVSFERYIHTHYRKK